MKSIKQFLSQPFLMWEHTTKRKIITILSLVIFCAVFIYVYQPFGYGLLSQKTNVILILMHALMNIVWLSFFYFVIPLGFNGFFKDESRTIGKEIIWVVTLILIITEGNRIINNFLDGLPYTSYLAALGFTIGIGIFPVLTLLLLALGRMSKEKNVSNGLDPANLLINITPSIGNDKIKLFLKDILYIKAVDNYSEIYFTDNNNTVKKKLLRIPLSTLISTQLKSEYFVRSHRSYVVNLYNIKTFKRGTHTSKIYLKGDDTALPVSKTRRNEVFKHLDKLPVSFST